MMPILLNTKSLDKLPKWNPRIIRSSILAKEPRFFDNGVRWHQRRNNIQNCIGSMYLFTLGIATSFVVVAEVIII